MSRAHKWFWALVAAQTLFLLGWAGYHEFVRQNAPVLLLKGRPVDPQDLLRGDYLTMRYDISEMPAIAGTAPQISAPEVWVLLEQKDRYYVVVRASYEKPMPKVGQMLVRGNYGGTFFGNVHPTVDYGIEKYFVPEGKGSPRFKLMEVEVSVSPAHRLYIKRVLLDGQAFP